jgi:hypothetical protein
MNDAVPVGRLEGFADFDRDTEHLVERQSSAQEPHREGLAAQVLHHEELGAPLAADVEQTADVGVVQRRDCPGFAVETEAPLRVRQQVVSQDLDRDRAMEACVDGAVHVAHATGANELTDLIRAECRANG